MPSRDHGLLVQPVNDLKSQPVANPRPTVERPRSGVPWAERVSQELDAVSATLCAAVGEARALLLALVQEEIRLGLERAVDDARATLDVPTNGVASEPTIPPPVNARRASDDGSSGLLAMDGVNAAGPLLRVVEEASDGDAGPAAHGSNGAAAAPAKAPAGRAASGSAGEMSNGTVRLVVEADGSFRRVVQFVDELCQRPQFRLLRLVGSRRRSSVEVWLGLREPLSVASALSQMRDVSRVVAADGLDGPDDERTFNVWLSGETFAG